MKVFIDNQQADIDHRTAVSLTLSVASQSQLDASRTGYTKTILLPATPHNRQLLAAPDDVNAAQTFNSKPHTARIEKDGCTLIEGVPYLHESVSRHGGYFRLGIVGAGIEWVRMAGQTMLKELDMGFSEVLTGQTIAQSWRWDKPLRWLPVQRPGFAPKNVSGNIVPPLRVLTSDDYHPFLNVAAMLRQIFAQAGYALESRFAESDFFRSLHISGNYPSHSVSGEKSLTDFLAGRLNAATAAADYYGRVYASPFEPLNSVGNIVDTVDPGKNVGGVTMANLFSNGGYFRTHPDGHVEFAPPRAMTAAFEFDITYITDYRIETDRIVGFDHIYLWTGNEFKLDLRLPWPDKKDAVLQSRSDLKLMLYDFHTGSYELEYKDNSGITWRKTLSVTTNPIPFSTDTSNWSECRLWRGGVLMPRTSWAIFDAAMPNSGTMEVQVTLRTAAVDITPGTPMEFHRIFFGGADPGMKLTLPAGTTLRPVFTSGPTVGGTVAFADAAAHDHVSCLSFVQALRHMFNLRFYTDQAARVIYMEPHDDFYGGSLVDWTQRVDLSKPVSVSDFSSADELAEQRDKLLVNPLFTAAENATGTYSRAADASLLQVESTDDSQNFPLTIVSYLGMEPLADGQMWGWPGNAAEYPLLACRSQEHGIDLSFEGLHSYWDAALELCANGRRIALSVALSSHEVEELVSPSVGGCDFRAPFRLALDGESFIARLEEVTDYNPNGGTTKCTFIK